MMCRKGKLNIYDLRGLAIVFALSTLFVTLPARSEGGDFLDSISKLEINNPVSSEAGSGESTSVNQEKDSNSKKAPQKQDAVRKKVSQNNKTESTINTLRKQNAELSAAVKAAEKKLDDTTRTLLAQIAALKAQSGQKESGDPADVSALTKKNAELTAAVEAAQKKLDDTTRTLSVQIAALKTQKGQSEDVQKATIETLTRKNLELSVAAKAAEKKLDETTRVLSAQIAELKTQNAQGESQHKTTLDALTKKNAELTAAAGAAQKTLDDTTRMLSAQITAAETAQKKYDASVLVLNDRNKKLQSTLDSLNIKKDDLNLVDKSNKNAYALGVFYLTQALSDVNKMADNDVKLTPSALVSGFNDAYNKKLKIKEGEIESIVNTLNAQLSSKYVNIEKRIMAKIKNKKYEVLPNGVYFVVDKKGKEKYKLNESLSMNILEKKFDGTPILNTMNSKMVYDKQIDPLMEKVLSSGCKGGMVTLYGQAGSLYSNTPAEINPDTLISITFELLP